MTVLEHPIHTAVQSLDKRLICRWRLWFKGGLSRKHLIQRKRSARFLWRSLGGRRLCVWCTPSGNKRYDPIWVLLEPIYFYNPLISLILPSFISFVNKLVVLIIVIFYIPPIMEHNAKEKQKDRKRHESNNRSINFVWVTPKIEVCGCLHWLV
jgi:hypothetical protein